MSFESNVYRVSNEQLEKYYKKWSDLTALTLCDIEIEKSGYGRWRITSTVKSDNDHKVTYKSQTTNAALIDAWKIGDNVGEEYEGYDNWDEVVSAMLSITDCEDYII